MFSSIARSAFFVAFIATLSRGQVLLWEIDGDPTTNVEFGFRIACVGDVDADGCDDFVVTDPRLTNSGYYRSGAFYVYSGRTQSLLWSLLGTQINGTMGERIANLGDIDGDGYDEFAITSEATNHVDVYSAKLGTILYSLSTLWGQNVGPVANAGDVDLDGVSDLLIGAIGSSSFEYLHAYLYSGKSGTMIYDWPYVGGESVAGTGDVDGDGYSDVLIGDPFASKGSGTNNGCVFVYSGRDGSLIREIDGKVDARYFGVSVRSSHDIDGDGVPDFLIGTTGPTPIYEYAHSGATGNKITSWSPSSGGWLDTTAEFAGDLDRDGVADILLNDGLGTGSNIHLISGRTRIDLWELQNRKGCIATGDFNGDGVVDVIVGDTSATPAGAVCAYSAGTVFIDGGGSVGSHITVKYLMQPNDGLLGIIGLPPPVSIPTPPFGGALEISPFVVLALLPPNSWPYSEFEMSGNIPNDPTLIGIQILFQGLTGPSFSSGHKDASWTNTATLTIK